MPSSLIEEWPLASPFYILKPASFALTRFDEIGKSQKYPLSLDGRGSG
jgi:hypothetical protein